MPPVVSGRLRDAWLDISRIICDPANSRRFYRAGVRDNIEHQAYVRRVTHYILNVNPQ